MNGHHNCQPPNDAYRSAFPDDGFWDALEWLARDLSGETDFLKYVPPEPRPNASAAHSLLCDLGFLSADAHEMTRRVPARLSDLLAALDATQSRPGAAIPVLQLLLDDPAHQLSSRDSPALRAALADLQVPECAVCSFVFVAAARGAELPPAAAQAGLVVVLNESGQRMNSRCPDLERFDVLLVVSVWDESSYGVELQVKNVEIFGGFQVGNVATVLRRRDLSRLVAVCAFLFFATPGRICANGGAERKHFMSGFDRRSGQIAEIFEKSETGRNAILIGCLSCGLRQGQME
jgi:hypothetical protein